MRAEGILAELAEHNTAIHAAVISDQTRAAHWTGEGYEDLNVPAFARYGKLLGGAVDMLDGGEAVRSVYLEFKGHSLLVKRLEDWVLMLLMDPMRRGGFRKAEVGLKLFLPRLLTALENGEGTALPSQPSPRPKPAARPLQPAQASDPQPAQPVERPRAPAAERPRTTTPRLSTRDPVIERPREPVIDPREPVIERPREPVDRAQEPVVERPREPAVGRPRLPSAPPTANTARPRGSSPSQETDDLDFDFDDDEPPLREDRVRRRGWLSRGS
ncbi:MAG: hypothetical protein AAGA32_14150 [Pseudomonadota bacterium]